MTHAGSHDSTQVAGPEVDNRAGSDRVMIDAEVVMTFLGEVSTGVKKPLQIAQDSLPVTLQRYDPLHAALLRVLRIIIRQPVEQTGLKFFDNCKFGHSFK